PGQEQRGDRELAAAQQARRREAHQLAVHEARAARVRGRQPAGEGGAALPRRRGDGSGVDGAARDRAAFTRLLTSGAPARFSFMKIALMCFSTARFVRTSDSAIASLLLPCAISA